MEVDVKTLELDKVCRVCLTVKKDMRPLFGEMVAEMLMDFSRIQLDNTDGWPDKICIQCVHQVSRCHAFKKRVENSDKELRQYIKGITVIVEEPLTQMEIHPAQTHQVIKDTRQEIHITRHDLQNELHNHVQHASVTIQQPQTHTQQPTTQQIVTTTTHQPQQMIITNGQLHNAQIINAAGQIVATAPLQSALATAQIQGQICQLVQTSNGTVQMIQQNGQPAQVVQIQRTSDDRCEIIVQPTEIQTDTTTHYYTEDDEIFSVTTQMQQEEIEHVEEVEQQSQADQIQNATVCLDESTIIEQDEEEIEEEIQEEEEEEDEEEEGVFTLELSEGSDCEDKEYLAEFVSAQTSCPYPGLFVCNLCRKEFKHSKWLQTHMKSHSNWIKANCKKQPQCEICFRSFKGPGMLKMHMKTHEKTPGKIPICKVCNKEFKSRTILYRHRQTHMEKLIQCGSCHKMFSTVSQIQSHQAKLKHEKIFKCSPCLITFTSINDLKTHLQSHVNSKEKRNGT